MAELMPDLLGKRYKEWAQLSSNAEHVIDWEVVPRGANIKYQSYDLVLHGDEDVEAYNCMLVDVSCWWLPVFGADAAETVSTTSALKNLYDKYVPKVDSTVPTAAWTVTDDDASIGDDDNELYFRPDRISLMSLTNPASPARLYNRREWLGWLEGKGYRTGSTTKCRYSARHRGFVRRGVPTPYPGYLVWVLTIPGDVSDSAFEVSSTFPPDGEFADLDFLAPMWDPIAAARSVGGANLDSWRRWAQSFVVEQGTGNRQSAAKKLSVRMKRQVCFERRVKASGTVSPDA